MWNQNKNVLSNMKAPQENTQESQKDTVQRVQQEPSTGGEAIIVDNRPATAVQRKLRSAMGSAEDTTNSIQRKTLPKPFGSAQQPRSRRNKTGLPDNLKSGIENLSGYSMDDVKVHYNSSKPAQLQAHAYAQGTDIHLAPGQQKHLPHEAWHVVQQKQGRVKPTRQLKSKVNINDDVGLEKEADVMGRKALNTLQKGSTTVKQLKKAKTNSKYSIQRQEKVDPDALNVIGENHGEINQELERRFAESIPNFSYWSEEFNFHVKHEGGINGGESLALRFLWKFRKNYIGTPNSNENFLSTFDFTMAELKGRLVNHKDQNINGEDGPLQLLSDINKRVEEVDRTDNKKVYKIAQDYIELEYDILENLKNHSSFKRMSSKKYLELDENSHEGQEKKLNTARSIYMYNHAMANRNLKGIWKIGEKHVEDIRALYPAVQIRFNLINRSDWKKELEEWEIMQDYRNKNRGAVTVRDVDDILFPDSKDL